MHSIVLVPVPDFPGCYVTRDGRAFTTSRGCVKEVCVECVGSYKTMSVSTGICERKNISLHCAVARTFLGVRPDGYVVAHLNGKPEDNRVENLEYVSPRENNAHTLIHGKRYDPEAVKALCYQFDIPLSKIPFLLA